jgi:hypothetical protein
MEEQLPTGGVIVSGVTDPTLHPPGGGERHAAGGGSEIVIRGGAAKSGPLTPEVMGPIAARYDFELA